MSELLTVEKKKRKTKKYDEVVAKIKKLISATGATYIPELCDALRDDWFPTATDVILQNNKGVQDEIRDKILKEWSYERGNETPWGDESIKMWFPVWLKDSAKVERMKAHGLEYNEKRRQKFLLETEQFKPKLDRIVEQLPEPPKEIEPEVAIPTVTETVSSGVYEPEPKREPTPEELYEDGIHGLAKAWEALTGKDHIPGIGEDVLIDYIKPSDKYRLRIFKGLDEAKAAHYHNVLVWSEMLIKRTLDMWDQIQKEKKDIQK